MLLLITCPIAQYSILWKDPSKRSSILGLQQINIYKQWMQQSRFWTYLWRASWQIQKPKRPKRNVVDPSFIQVSITQKWSCICKAVVTHKRQSGKSSGTLGWGTCESVARTSAAPQHCTGILGSCPQAKVLEWHISWETLHYMHQSPTLTCHKPGASTNRETSQAKPNSLSADHFANTESASVIKASFTCRQLSLHFGAVRVEIQLATQDKIM